MKRVDIVNVENVYVGSQVNTTQIQYIKKML